MEKGGGIKKAISQKLNMLLELNERFSRLLDDAGSKVDAKTRRAITIITSTLDKKVLQASKILESGRENFLLDLKLDFAEHLIGSWLPSVEQEIFPKLMKAMDDNNYRTEVSKVFNSIKKISFELMDIITR